MTTPADTKTGPHRTTPRADGAETAARIREAALRVLTRDGVLAGLSLQAVAKEAGVSQSLINHHFGSRQALLRDAFAARQREFAEQYHRMDRAQPMTRSARWVLAGAVRNPEWAWMMAFLALDGDGDFEPFVAFDELMDEHRADVASGELVDDIDPEATHAAWIALAVGWALLREAASRQIGVPMRELDARVESTALRMIEVFIPESERRPLPNTRGRRAAR